MATDISESIKLRLHYWNCRGRVQSVRYILEDITYMQKNVDYKESFEMLETAMESWPLHKTDESISGPFHNLPVLHWNETHTFGQTLALAQLSARKFHLYGKLTTAITDEDMLRGYIDGVVSCAYTDVIANVLLLIWNEFNFNDGNSPFRRGLLKLSGDLKTLNGLLEKSSTSFYYDQLEPTIADYFVFEAYTLARDYDKRIVPNDDDYRALIQLEQIMKQRPALANYFTEGRLFKRFTGSPKEAQYMATLH